MSKKLRELKARKAALVASAQQLTTQASAAGRDFTAEEATQFDELKASIEGVNRQIEAEEFIASQQASLGSSVDLPGSNILSVHDNRADDPARGFKSFGEFAASVRAASDPTARKDERLLIGAAAPSTFGSEGVGGDGGFLIPPQFGTEIWQHSLAEDSLLPLTDNTEVGGNSMVFPKDETTPWGTDGIRSYWQQEASQANATKPKISTQTLRLHKLLTLVPITDELLADSVALGGYLTKKLPISIRWKTNEAILFGTGVGQPLGAMNSNALVVVPKDAGQQALTLSPMNISNMVARLPPGALARAIWIMNNDVLPALDNLTLGNYPIYQPVSQGAQASPYGMLKSRPVSLSQHAKSFGAQGDLNLLDLSYYRTITKAEGITTATSLHLYFDADAVAFRATFRIDGAPAISSPINPANGSNKLSPFISLGAR